MSVPDLARTAAELAASLPVERPDLVARQRAAADERPIAHPLGSGQAEEVALAAGLKPAVRQLLDDASRAAMRARCERLGLCVAETRAWVIEAKGSEAPRFVQAVAFVAGRDAARVDAIVDLERRRFDAFRPDAPEPERDVGAIVTEQGRLLGYPRCCTEAFAELEAGAGNAVAFRRALARSSRALPRLDVLDLAVFHYLPWLPCAFDCELSARYADAVAARIAVRHAAFVARIDAALAAHRLFALEDVQVSLEGRWDGARVRVERAWPTARDRHPSAPLDPAAREAVARLAALVEAAGEVEVAGEAIVVGGRAIARTRDALLVGFGG